MIIKPCNISNIKLFFNNWKKTGDDLIYFLEDDYLHFKPMQLEEMMASYERIASQLNKIIFMCPSDYPYLYIIQNEKKKNF